MERVLILSWCRKNGLLCLGFLSVLPLPSIPFFFSSPAVLRGPCRAGRGQAESFSPGGICCRFSQELEQEQEPDWDRGRNLAAP